MSPTDDDSPASAAHDAVLEHFAWIDGHADVWSMLRDATTLRRIVTALAEPFRSSEIDVVVGIESRGFILAPAVALELGAGFAAIRKGDALFPGEKTTESTAPDYRGNTHPLSALTGQFAPDDRVLLVDDWIETGSQARSARTLIERCGATLVGVSVVIDEASEEARAALPPISRIVSATELS
ncbi:phosphoribosyltransferase family protein [Plantibacter sp. YIM 135249]|uniref:phosphoribosyltransferase family protein n=1 Tax=Plantibacter sp. YIM 135249 TaxID=3423918 RepID=UPI003D32A66D